MNIFELQQKLSTYRDQALDLQTAIKEGDMEAGHRLFHINSRINELKKLVVQHSKELPALHIIQHESGKTSALVGPMDKTEMQLSLFQEKPGWFVVHTLSITEAQLEEIPEQYVLA